MPNCVICQKPVVSGYVLDDECLERLKSLEAELDQRKREIKEHHEALMRAQVENLRLERENERLKTENEAAKSDIAALLRGCECEHRHEYCKGTSLEECSGHWPGDCSEAEWRGLGGTMSKTIEIRNMSMPPEAFHRAVQIGLARRECRERKVKVPDDYFENMTTEEVERWRKEVAGNV